jgi:hypothetical protein
MAARYAANYAVNYLTAPLETLSLTQLFARQAQANLDHERALIARNQHSTISAEWDLWNAALTGFMIDLADIAKAITARIADMRAEHDAEPLHHVPMVCTTCRKPVRECPNATCTGHWRHVLADDSRGCLASGFAVKAMVAAGNESVPRNA